jgi:3-hydroxyacyl-CoA dehydrogenase
VVPLREGVLHLHPDPAVNELIDAQPRSESIQRREFSDADILRRAILAMVNEAAGVLEDGIATRASDIDVTITPAYGFPCLPQRER